MNLAQPGRSNDERATRLAFWQDELRGGALVFAGALAVVAALYFFTNASRVLAFWTAFILTRPTVDDFLDKPASHGGMALSRPLASAALAGFIVLCLDASTKKEESKRRCEGGAGALAELMQAATHCGRDEQHWPSRWHGGRR